MSYSSELASDFWYEFDNYFAWEHDKHPEADSAHKKLGDVVTSFRKHRQNRTFPESFVEEIKNDPERNNAILVLAKAQFDIISKYFSHDLESQQLAFEDFGQGVLFDDRPPRWKEARIHMMDDDLQGYCRWHAFIRALVLIEEKDRKMDETWLQIDRHVGLASAIHNKQKPRQTDDGTNPNNPKIDRGVLVQLRNYWLPMNFERLDNAFDQYIGSLDIEKS